MDIENLNKTQIILLTLLVSFVTSIATGIVTVTLLDQAPAPVTRTINRVVERTVETVVPSETKIIETVREVQVGETESDLIVKAVDKNNPAVGRVETADGSPLNTGFFVNPSGLFVTTSGGIKAEGSYNILLANTEGEINSLEAYVAELDSESGFAILRLVKPEGESNSPLSIFTDLVSDDGLPYIVVPEASSVSLGEKLLVLGNRPGSGSVLATGHVIAVVAGGESTSPSIQTDVAKQSGINGGPAVNLSGKLQGIYLDSYDGETQVVIPVSVLYPSLAPHLSLGDSLLDDNLAGVGELLDGVDTQEDLP